MIRLLLICVVFLASVGPTAARGDTVIDFENAATAAQFDGDIVSDTAGPFLIDNFPVTFTTTGLSPAGSALSTSSFGVGINSGGADPDSSSFNIDENWSVSANVKLFLMIIEFGGLQIEETITVQSDAWINLPNVVPGDSSVSFNAGAGALVFTDNGVAGDVFDLNAMTGGTPLPIPIGTSILFGNLTSSFGPNDDVEIENIAFHAVPEPSVHWVIILAFGVAMATRKRQRIIPIKSRRRNRRRESGSRV